MCATLRPWLETYGGVTTGLQPKQVDRNAIHTAVCPQQFSLNVIKTVEMEKLTKRQVLLNCFHKQEIQHFLPELRGFYRLGPYVFRICFTLGIMAASLNLALVCRASSHSITGASRGLSWGLNLTHGYLGLTPAEGQHYSQTPPPEPLPPGFLSIPTKRVTDLSWEVGGGAGGIVWDDPLGAKVFPKRTANLQRGKGSTFLGQWRGCGRESAATRQLSRPGSWGAGGLISLGRGCSHVNRHGYTRPLPRDVCRGRRRWSGGRSLNYGSKFPSNYWWRGFWLTRS